MKKNEEKKSLKRQLVSGAVYVALAGVVVAVTVNTTVGIISDKNTDSLEKLSELDTKLPSIPEIPPLSIPKAEIIPEAEQSSPVSDVPEGIDSTVTEPDFSVSEIAIPQDADLGFDKYINPCGGFVTKEFSIEMPVYSTTMGDYRTHPGIDISADKGTPVCAAIGGIVTEVYDDDLLGKTVCMKNADGYTIKYSNLMPELYATVEVGSVLVTGEKIGGVGDTAICEYVDAGHLHLEILDQNGEPVNPEDFINF